jgi:hypothetical protein
MAVRCKSSGFRATTSQPRKRAVDREIEHGEIMAPPLSKQTRREARKRDTPSIDESPCCTKRRLIDVIGEIGSVPADERKNGRTERVHPVQPEKVDSGAGGNTALLDRSASRIKNGQLHPLETKAISIRPDDGADVLLAKVQRVDTVDTNRRKRRWDFCLVEFGTNRLSGGQLVCRLNEDRVALVGGVEQLFGVLGKHQRSIVYAQHPSYQTGARAAQATGIEIVATIDARHN